MNKILSIIRRDLKIASGDGMAIYMGIAPILIAIIILIISPGISDSTVRLAVHGDIDDTYIEQMEDYAKIEIYDTVQKVEKRVLARDEVIGVVSSSDGYELLAQGNESEYSVKMAKALTSLYNLGAFEDEDFQSRMSFYSFNEKVAPLKLALSIGLILMITVISSMIIALGLVDEKSDKTIRAANVTPMKQTSYVLAKSAVGIIDLLLTSVIVLLILGIYDINWIQMIIMIISCSFISIILAYVMGLTSTDFIEAAGTVKIVMLPLLGSVLVYELAAESWHWTVMWSPFFWAYKGITEIINHTATWGNIGIYTLIIVVISAVVFKIGSIQIRKALN